ncbi:hypothetical protein PYW07_010701 [Mythimna separata]|uniref:Serine protease K12H4.7 n=1 Tax=Mythimna separata TaxID=271217 RepID=A0AAD7Y7K1_MYTSE|nr:hypothetical protein PYW07_010701 [Mythimna separata]
MNTVRLWTYQTCAEFGWYQTTNSTRQPFLHVVPVEYFHQMCKDFYSSYLDETRLRWGIDRTNIFFGGLNNLPDYVVSVAGGHDPWSPMAPNKTHAHHNAPVYVVPGVSHCKAIRPTGESDVEELEAVKQAVLRHMYEFTLGPEDEIPSRATGAALSVAALLLAVLAAL